MKNSAFTERRKKENKELRLRVERANERCSNFFKEVYVYSEKAAVCELGLDADLIWELIDDYVIQIVKSELTFRKYLQELKTKKTSDFTPFRELAHKNLGVARNLRIVDSEFILNRLMKSDNLQELEEYLDLLEDCTIRLRPQTACNTLRLIKIKSTL